MLPRSTADDAHRFDLRSLRIARGRSCVRTSPYLCARVCLPWRIGESQWVGMADHKCIAQTAEVLLYAMQSTIQHIRLGNCEFNGPSRHLLAS